jgi:hypothetical protein
VAFNIFPSLTKTEMGEIFKVSRAPRTNNHFLSYFSANEEIAKLFLYFRL